MRWKKLLCAIDFSAHSREALRVAAELAGSDKIPLVLIHVVQPIPIFPEAASAIASAQEDIAKANKGLAEWKVEATTLGAPNVEILVAEGIAWDRIVHAAKEGACDLIVMGTQGRTGLKHAFLGSVAERVVRHASDSVLVVRAKK